MDKTGQLEKEFNDRALNLARYYHYTAHGAYTRMIAFNDNMNQLIKEGERMATCTEETKEAMELLHKMSFEGHQLLCHLRPIDLDVAMYTWKLAQLMKTSRIPKSVKMLVEATHQSRYMGLPTQMDPGPKIESTTTTTLKQHVSSVVPWSEIPKPVADLTTSGWGLMPNILKRRSKHTKRCASMGSFPRYTQGEEGITGVTTATSSMSTHTPLQKPVSTMGLPASTQKKEKVRKQSLTQTQQNTQTDWNQGRWNNLPLVTVNPYLDVQQQETSHGTRNSWHPMN